VVSVWSEVQTCIWPSWCHCHSLSLASVKSRLVLPLWYRPTRVVPEKGPLNGCVCVCCCLINVPDVSHPVSICGIWIDVNIYFVVPCIWTLINSVATLLKLHSLDYHQVGNLCINYQHSVAGNMVLHSNAHTCSCKGITALEMAEGKPPYGDIHPMRVCIVPLLVIKLNNWNLVVKWKLFFS